MWYTKTSGACCRNFRFYEQNFVTQTNSLISRELLVVLLQVSRFVSCQWMVTLSPPHLHFVPDWNLLQTSSGVCSPSLDSQVRFIYFYRFLKGIFFSRPSGVCSVVGTGKDIRGRQRPDTRRETVHSLNVGINARDVRPYSGGFTDGYWVVKRLTEGLTRYTYGERNVTGFRE